MRWQVHRHCALDLEVPMTRHAACRRHLTWCSTLIGLVCAVPVVAAGPDGAVHVDGLEWAPRSNGADVKWPEADAFCRDLELDHHDNWRLPTLHELEAVHDPAQPAGIQAPIHLDGCCLWSATTLEQLPPDDGSSVAVAPSRYHWGLVFDGGIRYYSIDLQPDGRALCVRDPE
jgi:hypothetical protein